jgi:hypothetical protein
VSKHHVFPRLKPGGRKTLADGFETQGGNLLFHNLTILPKKEHEVFAKKTEAASTDVEGENTSIGFDLLLIAFV